MMTEQEDEEEKVKWRVDAEVKLAMEEFRAAESEHTADTQGMTVFYLSQHPEQILCMHCGNAKQHSDSGTHTTATHLSAPHLTATHLKVVT